MKNKTKLLVIATIATASIAAQAQPFSNSQLAYNSYIETNQNNHIWIPDEENNRKMAALQLHSAQDRRNESMFDESDSTLSDEDLGIGGNANHQQHHAKPAKPAKKKTNPCNCICGKQETTQQITTKAPAPLK